jgi:chlorite dismutase
MNKKRGEVNNWYRETIDKRAELMMEHGMTGRRYAGKIQQIISGSIGFDGWEWGVDLFANNPLDIKALIYEMRFDEVTSLYGEFGEFWFGKRIEDVSGWLCA